MILIKGVIFMFTLPKYKGKLKPSFELFGPSKDVVFKNLDTLLWILVLPLLYFMFINLASYFVNGPSWERNTTVSAEFTLITTLLIVIGAFITLMLYPALQFTLLKGAQGKKVSLGEAWQGGLKYFWRIIGLSLAVGLIVTFGLILFIIPGLIFLRRYYLSPFYLIDKNIGIGEAMSLSARDSKPVSGYIYGLFGVQVVFGLIGAVPLVGNIISTVLAALYSAGPALRYEEIKKLKPTSD
jgi:hypothetical protein